MTPEFDFSILSDESLEKIKKRGETEPGDLVWQKATAILILRKRNSPILNNPTLFKLNIKQEQFDELQSFLDSTE